MKRYQYQTRIDRLSIELGHKLFIYRSLQDAPKTEFGDSAQSETTQCAVRDDIDLKTWDSLFNNAHRTIAPGCASRQAIHRAPTSTP